MTEKNKEPKNVVDLDEERIIEICKSVNYGKIEIVKEAGKIVCIKKTESIKP